MPFSDAVAAEVLAKCGRHCCICRRFRPRHIQVHHIVDESAGGVSDAENAIPICLTCHSDVHSSVPFARRFTADELRRHRASVYQMVAEGKLVPPDDEQLLPTMKAMTQAGVTETLSCTEVEVLVGAAHGDGQVMTTEGSGGFSVTAGKKELMSGFDSRTRAAYLDAIARLRNRGLLHQVHHDPGVMLLDVTHGGYAVADDILSANNN